ncbi:FadR family transcriptional regulator [Sphingomonas sp. JC676]|uniref:FadR/GntR family transcriptional regulator n=1 Tax=Sphingomonas sp. JC676 TaxID=2768065 RepID=UPI001657AFAF|nr:FadR/GntR family transcriptional regulator [Sphingomonas sp. JC676]MBC9032026.1 FadR family transcriptional regulator [Sphingomonas sp. JC676]
MASPAKFHKYTEGTLSSHDQVARALGMDILGGIYPPGSKIPGESEILHRFGVSRTVLREVLKTLTAKGLIVSKTRVGTTVLDSSHWNFFDADVLSWKVGQSFDAGFRRDLTEVRLALEPAAAFVAAERRSAEDLAELRRCIAEMRAATSSAREFAEADLDFHRAVGRASGNVLMQSMSAVVETALVASFTLSSPVREEDEHEVSVRGHERIVDAIEVRDGAAAAQAMRNVIGHGVERLAKAEIEAKT